MTDGSRIWPEDLKEIPALKPKQPKPKRFVLTRVDWVDSHILSGWRDREEVEKGANDPTYNDVVSIGIKLIHNDHYLVLAQSIDSVADSPSNVILIPTCCIRSIHMLVESE